MEIILTESNKNRILSLLQQKEQIQNSLTEIVSIILDAKEIDYNGKDVLLSEDNSAIIIKDKEGTTGTDGHNTKK